MLHRHVDGGYLIVTQPAHAWVSGQIAAAWGNARTGSVEPRAELVLAAQQHDIGWLQWEAAPTLNPETGRPRTFLELPTMEHLAVWAPAGPAALVYGPYVAMLVSMHGTGLYQRHDYARDTEEEAAAARRFVADGAAFEARLLEQLRAGAYPDELTSDAVIAGHRKLVSVWDAMSLFLCGGLNRERTLEDVPMQDGAMPIRMIPDTSHRDVAAIDPWPFSGEELELTCPARVMQDTFAREDDMRRAVAGAPWTLIRVLLKAAS